MITYTIQSGRACDPEQLARELADLEPSSVTVDGFDVVVTFDESPLDETDLFRRVKTHRPVYPQAESLISKRVLTDSDMQEAVRMLLRDFANRHGVSDTHRRRSAEWQ